MEESKRDLQREIEKLEIEIDRLKLALEAADVAYWDQDFRTGTVKRSPLWAEMLGYNTEDINCRKRTWIELIHPDERSMVMKKAKEHECGLSPDFRVEHRLLTGKGDYKWILNWGKVIERDDQGTPLRAMGIHMDISERKKMEDEIIRAEKMKSIGILSAGIAHDFNNMLAVMLGNISLLKAACDNGGRMKRLIGEVEKACIRSRDLTSELMTFTRSPGGEKETVGMYDLVQESTNLTLLGSNVRCSIDEEKGVRPVTGDRSQLKRVICNICLNARQAMPDGGEIRISCGNYRQNPGGGMPIEPGEYVRIRVEDTGEGIPRSIQDRIFDPFFSTRDNGRGVGLAASDSIVRKHGGYISFSSEKGKGSSFVIYLPASDEQPVERRRRTDEVVEGSGCVLVVDDEESIRRMAGEMLGAIGYEVDTANGEEEAVRLYRKKMEEGSRYDAVILDLTIPGEKGGREIFSRLREVDSGVKAIVSSGYSDEDVVANYRDYGFNGSLAKPYRISRISQVLKEVIDSG
jgi:PAS domain S-box-containing protein